MWLFIDAGNTHIKCLIRGSQEPGLTQQFVTSDYENSMNDSLLGLSGIDRILVSSVIGKDFESWLSERCSQLGLVAPEFLRTSSIDLGVRVSYDDPTRFGIDRYLAMAAGYQLVRKAVTIVDCGTAITVDGVTGCGEHLGGVIMPGIEMMKEALFSRTKGIEYIDAEEIDCFSHSTASGVHSGALFAAVGGIREVIERQTGLMNERPECLITGGASPIIAEYLGPSCQVCHNLVFDGLLMFAKQ